MALCHRERSIHVKRYLRGRSPLGMLVCEGAGPDDNPDVVVVGVMSQFESYRGLREESEQVFSPSLKATARRRPRFM